MKISDYPRVRPKREIENPTRDNSDPRPVVWDQGDSEDRPVGYHHEEGLQYVQGGKDCECGGSCGCSGDCGASCSCKAPERDMNPFEDVPGYYPESGDYHEEVPALVASKKEEKDEYPFPLRELAERHKSLDKAPFQVTLGGKVLSLLVGDAKDLYLAYEAQQQVVHGEKGLKQAPILSRILALLVELWPTSVFEVTEVEKFRKEVLAGFLEWFLEFGELPEESMEKVQELLKVVRK